MIRYSVQHRDQIIVKDYGYLSFGKNIDENIGKNTSKDLSGRYSQKLMDHAKQSAALKISSEKKAIQKAEGVTGDLIGNKITNCFKQLITK